MPSPVATALGPVRQPPPKTWQLEPSGERQQVACRYVLRGVGGFGLEASGWDPHLALIVDPGLIYSTFLGGGLDDFGGIIALDAAGAATLAGTTYSTDFPTTPGAFDTLNAGGYIAHDAFVTKLDPSVSALIFSTYLGGSNNDRAGDIALDPAGNVTVCGYTKSQDFPVTMGSYDTSYNGGGQDVFVTRLDSSGSALIYSTFLGGSAADRASHFALDSSGAATVCGATSSADFPVTVGAYDTTYEGSGGDAFVTRLSPSGSTLLYSTFLGGGGSDSSAGIALGGPSTVTVVGITKSADFPTTPAGYDPTPNGEYDTYVTRIDLTSGPIVTAIQPGGPGSPLTIDNLNLVSGNEHHNLFNLDLCPAGPGTGPYLGLCITSPANVQFLVDQIALPLGTPLFHFTAPSPSVAWGPYPIPPMTLDAICLDLTAGPFTSFSPVTRITIQ